MVEPRPRTEVAEKEELRNERGKKHQRRKFATYPKAYHRRHWEQGHEEQGLVQEHDEQEEGHFWREEEELF